jgi:HK97 family phage major capsid protein
MYARMLPSSLNTAVWVASPDTFAQLATMALTVGTGGSAVWLTDGRGAPVLTLLGRPVIMTEKAPAALGSVGDLSFVDFSMYLIGDYQTLTIDSSPHVKFTSTRRRSGPSPATTAGRGSSRRSPRTTTAPRSRLSCSWAPARNRTPE